MPIRVQPIALIKMNDWNFVGSSDNSKSTNSWDFLGSSDSSTQSAIKAWAYPSQLAWAKSHIDPVAYNNLCLQFVDDALGLPNTNRSPTAISAWQSPTNQKVQGLQGVQPGDPVFFGPTNTVPEGHTGLYSDNGKFISGQFGEQDINQWSQNEGQPVLGYMPAGQFK